MYVDFYPIEDFSYLNDKLQAAIEEVDSGSPFVAIDLDLSEYDKLAFDSLKIEFIKDYKNFNEISSLHNEVTDFLQSLSSSNNKTLSNYLSNIILNIVDGVMTTKSDPQYGVVVYLESFLSSQENTMDWHADKEMSDKCYFSSKDEVHNFLVTLKGQSTLYYIPSPEIILKLRKECSKYWTHECEGNAKIAKMLNSNYFGENIISSNVFSSRVGYATVHLVSSDIGVIHSTPQITQDRLLLAIRMAAHEDIQNFQRRIIYGKKIEITPVIANITSL